jgi:hypothetical protein
MAAWLRKLGIALVAATLSLVWTGGAAEAASTTSYQLMLQSRSDTAAPNEVYLASFASLDDVFSQTIGAPTGFTQIEITPGFEITGMTKDASGFRVLLQSRADTAALGEVYLASFNSLDDIFSQTIGSPTAFTQIEITPGFRIADFTWDGSGYRMLLQSRLDAAAPNFRIVGFSSVTTMDPLPPGVPEPMSWALLIIGFGATGAVMRGRRQFA